MDTFLPPIEHPKGYFMKLLYALTRKKYGKVLTPLKVYGARLPLAFGSFYGIDFIADKKLYLPNRNTQPWYGRWSPASTSACSVWTLGAGMQPVL
jgi:hypothetical protein